MSLRIRIHAHQRGLHFLRGNFARFLAPGAYLMPGRVIRRDRVWVVDTRLVRFDHELLEQITRNAQASEELEIVNLAQHERALVWRAGRVLEIVGPGLYAYWKTPESILVERFDARSGRLVHEQLDAVLLSPGASKFLTTFDVSAGEEALVFQNGRLLEHVSEGRHVFWSLGRLVARSVDRRERVLDVSGQEIMTRDKVTLRVNLLVGLRVTDAVRAVTAVEDFSQAIYRGAQLALRAAVGARALDDLLASRTEVGDEIRSVLTAQAASYGAEIISVGLRDVILPGDMKEILNRVIEAEKSAQANLVKRREETAAARSQANTARLFAENPMTLRLRELEVLQEVLTSGKTTFNLGAADLIGQLRSMVGRETGS